MPTYQLLSMHPAALALLCAVHAEIFGPISMTATFLVKTLHLLTSPRYIITVLRETLSLPACLDSARRLVQSSHY